MTLTPAEIIERFQKLLGEGLRNSRIVKRSEGKQTRESVQVWLTLDKSLLHSAVKQLADIHYPHLAVISGCDVGDVIELNYHFFIYYEVPNGEVNVTIKVLLPKTDLTVRTITDILPGALVSEREKQEFFGIKVIDIPDSRRLFLPEDFPEGVYPWRKDETGIPEDMVKKLYEVGKGECGMRKRDDNKQPGHEEKAP
ncbi:NADH-quinone oxidoreductase subunit C [bacterium]|nr:NADH-quinone oxidoreductase subunit C [bacterium]